MTAIPTDARDLDPRPGRRHPTGRRNSIRPRSTRSTSRTTSRRRRPGTSWSPRTRAGTTSTASRAGAGKTTARLWKVPLNNPEAGKAPLLAVDQALDENANAALGAIDVDAAATPRGLGAWESSGIVDASAAFGPGAFFLTIQAHSYWVAKQAGPDVLNAPERRGLLLQEGRRTADPAEDARRLGPTTVVGLPGHRWPHHPGSLGTRQRSSNGAAPEGLAQRRGAHRQAGVASLRTCATWPRRRPRPDRTLPSTSSDESSFDVLAR